MSGDLHRKETEAAIAEMEKRGRTIQHMSDEELAKVQQRLEPLTVEWLDKAKTAGMENPQEMLDFFRAPPDRPAQ